MRADFIAFCDFEDTELPDHSKLCRFRQWLIANDLLKVLLKEINHQLEQQGLKVNQAQMAIVDASIIQSAGAPKRKALEVCENGTVKDTEVSADTQAVKELWS